MANPQILWLAGLYVSSITINTGLLKIITDDKIPRPNVVAGYLNALLTLIGGIGCYYFLGILTLLLFVPFNLISFLILVYLVTRRDKKALLYAEKLFPFFLAIDLQITFILSEIGKSDKKYLEDLIDRAHNYVLSEMPIIFGFDATHETQTCILAPKNFRFNVVANSGIPNYKIKKMEESFRYGPNHASVAGLAVNERKTIIINDLSDYKNKDGQNWIKITNEENKEGSMIAHPIFHGIGSSEGEPIAVLCVTSLKKNAFNLEESKKLLTFLSAKVEIIQSCWNVVFTDN